MKRHCISFFFLCCFCVFAFADEGIPTDLIPLKDSATGTFVPYAGNRPDSRIVKLPRRYEEQVPKLRAVWIALVENIDFPRCATAAQFKKAALIRLNNIKAAGFQAVVFQVRPACDAVYPSVHNPWSRYLTGTEGAALSGDPSFDPLRFLITEAHKRGLEFHAWLNPYRVSNRAKMPKSQYLKTLDPKHFAARNPDWVIEVPSGSSTPLLILNPGEPQVLKHLIDTVSEIICHYDVDAIHMDDYFYPYEEIGSADAATYRKYAKKGQSLEDWRRENVNRLVQMTGRLIRMYNAKDGRHVRFGISPFGIWANQRQPRPNTKDPAVLKKWLDTPYRNDGSLTGGSQTYFRQYADTKKWIQNGWIDYIVPQLYWSFQHPQAPYAALADWWADTVRGTKVELYIGHGCYRPGTARDWQDPQELPNQLKYNLMRPEIKGSFFFSYRRVFEPDNAVQKKAFQTIIRNFWGAKLPY